MKEYYFPTHEQAQKFKSGEEKKGNTAEVIPRLRLGTIIYCVKVTDKGSPIGVSQTNKV